MAGILRFSNVTKEYARSGEAIRNISFELNKGEFLFLAGHSGAGKSTLLRLLSMAERPTRGEVRVSGFSSTTIKDREIPKLRRRLGIVFQDFRLLPDRTAEANIAFALEVTGAPRASIHGRVARLLTQVGLAAKGTAFPHELSGGEQQRVAIARALVNDPFILLADEHLANRKPAFHDRRNRNSDRAADTWRRLASRARPLAKLDPRVAAGTAGNRRYATLDRNELRIQSR